MYTSMVLNELKGRFLCIYTVHFTGINANQEILTAKQYAALLSHLTPPVIGVVTETTFHNNHIDQSDENPIY